MNRRNQRRFGVQIRAVILGLATLITVGLIPLGFIAQLYADEMRQWLDSLLQNNNSLWFVVAAVAFFMGVFYIAERIKEAPSSDDPPAALSGTSDLAPVARLGGDLETFRRREGFIDAARRSEVDELTQCLSRGGGRYTWMARTLRLLTFGRAYAAPPQSIALMTGIGGIGKTSLAKRVAFAPKLRRYYPDGQYYFDFNGLYDDHRNENTAQALSRLLKAAWPEQRARIDEIATSETRREQYTQLYQKFFAGRRLLLILDDPPEQVDLECLLPPPNCGLLLVARPGHKGLRRLNHYQQLKLEPLSDASALELLQLVWTTAFDPALASALAHLCSNIPLALVVIGKTVQDGITNHGAGFAPQILAKLQGEHAKQVGLVARFFDQFLPFSPDLPERQGIDQVLRLSYNLLQPLAQQMFRGLAIFETHPFSAELAQTVCSADDGEQSDELFAQIVVRGLVTKRQEEPDQAARYALYDLLFFYARRELENEHKAEIPVLRERYLTWLTTYVASVADQLRTGADSTHAASLASFAHEGDHLLVGYATLTDARMTWEANERSPDAPGVQIKLTPEQRDRWLLNLIGPGLVALHSGRLHPTAALAPLCLEERSNQWQTTGQGALARTLARLSPALRTSFAHLGLFDTWFDPQDARVITKTKPAQIAQLVACGLIRAQGERYLMAWPLLREAAHAAYQALPAPAREQIERRYAQQYAQRLNTEGLTEQIVGHVERGQRYAAAADPPMPHEVITYAEKCYWHFGARRAYALLRDWLEQAFKAAEQTGNDEAASLALQRLGDVCVDSGDADLSQRPVFYTQAERHYQRVLDAFPNADEGTRANAYLGLGVVAERRNDLEDAERHYQRVLRDFPNADEETRAIAQRGLGNIARLRRG